MTRFLAAIGVFALAVGSRAADAPAPPPTFESLVAQLGATHYLDREAAAKSLDNAGAAAIPALEAGANGSNPEIARRSGELLAKHRRIADSAVRLKAKTIRLSYQGLPLGVAVHDLKARTGINITLDPLGVADPLRKVTCETGELPPWEAMAEFCKAAGLREVFLPELPVPKPERQGGRRSYYSPPPPPTAEGVAVTLADGKYEALPGSRATAVRVLALPRNFPNHRVTLGTGEFSLTFDVTPVPGLNWQEVIGVRVTKAIDEAGRPGAGGTLRDDASGFDPYGGQVVFARGGAIVMLGDWEGNPVALTSQPNPRLVSVPLKLASSTVKSLRLLEGAVVCEVIAPGQVLATIPDPARREGMTYSAGATKITVADVRPDESGKGTVIRVQMESPSPSASMRRRNPFGPMWPDAMSRGGAGMNPELKAFDAAGKPLAASRTTVQPNDDGEAMTTTLVATFPGGTPAKLQVVGPKVTTVDVPFRMENVPLP